MTRRFSRTLPAAFGLAALGLAALSVPADAQAAPPGTITVPERTEVRVVLQDELKSGASKSGDEVDYEVDRDVYGPGRVLLIPAGAHAYGKVTRSSRRGMFGKPGKLDFTCDYVLLPDRSHVPLRSSAMGDRGRDNSGASLATALFLFLPAIFMNGRDVTVHKGQQFTVFVDRDTQVAAAPSSAPAGSGPVRSLFTLKDGTQVAGALSSFDGTTYVVATDKGPQSLKAADVKSVYALAAVPAPQVAGGAAAAPTTAATQAAPPEPKVRIGAIGNFELKGGQSVYGHVKSFDGAKYTVATLSGDKTVPVTELQYAEEVSPPAGQ